MAVRRRFKQDGAAIAAVLLVGVLAMWCCPTQAQDEDHAIGIQFGIDGGELPFFRPFVAMVNDIGVVCGAGEQCDSLLSADGPCCAAEGADVVAHFCPGSSSCAVCPGTAKAHGGAALAVANQPLVSALIDALSAKASLEAELCAWERFEEERRHLTEELLGKEVENMELKAALEIAEHRHQLQEQMMEMMAENVRLQAQVELAQQKQQYVDHLAKNMLENEKLKLQVTSLEHHEGVAKQAKAKLAKAKAKGAKAKEHGKVAKSNKGGKDLRTAKRSAKEAGEAEQSR